MSALSSFRRRLMVGAYPKEQPNYLCFTALESGTFTLTMAASMPVEYYNYAAYSLDEGKTWTSVNNVNSELVTLTTPTVSAGDTVMWKGKGTRVYGMVNTEADNCICFSSTCRFTAKGFLASFCTKKPKNETTTRIRSYGNIFNRCTTLVDASELILPEFTSAASAVFYGLFYGCTSLTAAPTLSSTTLSSQCYGYMFYGCTSLEALPSLPATTLANNCYEYMFKSCTGITTIPSGYLPATTLTTYCYREMFSDCTSLVNVPTNLLSATTMQTYCYGLMFNGCSSLETAPNLPATTLADDCYRRMFIYCEKLTTAPVLAKEVLTTRCYYQMFYNCKALRYLKMLATDISASNCMYQWVNGMTNSSAVVFVKNISATWTITGISGTRPNWTIIYYDPALDKYYLDQQRQTECDDHGNPI